MLRTISKNFCNKSSITRAKEVLKTLNEPDFRDIVAFGSITSGAGLGTACGVFYATIHDELNIVNFLVFPALGGGIGTCCALPVALMLMIPYGIPISVAAGVAGLCVRATNK